MVNKLNVTIIVADIPEAERARRWAALSKLLIPIKGVGPSAVTPDPDAKETTQTKLPTNGALVRHEDNKSSARGQESPEN